MNAHDQYTPGPAAGARIRKSEALNWELVVVRELRHSPEKIWQAITDPDHLREWAPFEADKNLGTAGVSVKLTTVNAPASYVTETRVLRADAPHFLEYVWGANPMRWELEPIPGGTRLTLSTAINKNFISMGAAGWHVCFDVLDHLLANNPIGRLVGSDTMKFAGWQRLTFEYAERFGLEPPKHMPQPRQNS
ncbi:MAG: SRPBCC domain-containing protein [Acidobacteria bacterium]|nr:SRPBCC domain-containing protein [Acidobacteriota bacterium]